MKPVNGYPGQNDVLLAMERGELDGHPSAFFSSLRSTRPAWLRDKTAKAIVQYGPEKLAELPDVPFAPDLVASDDDRLLMQAAFAPLTLAGRSSRRPAFRSSAWPRCAMRSRPPWPTRTFWRRAKGSGLGLMRPAPAHRFRR